MSATVTLLLHSRFKIKEVGEKVGKRRDGQLRIALKLADSMASIITGMKILVASTLQRIRSVLQSSQLSRPAAKGRWPGHRLRLDRVTDLAVSISNGRVFG
jgi:hypothetical protein